MATRRRKIEDEIKIPQREIWSGLTQQITSSGLSTTSGLKIDAQWHTAIKDWLDKVRTLWTGTCAIQANKTIPSGTRFGTSLATRLCVRGVRLTDSRKVAPDPETIKCLLLSFYIGRKYRRWTAKTSVQKGPSIAV
jgi:hypothetical protein